MRMVFMGTPDYSVVTLKALYDAGHDIVGVFAQPDKPVGRKQILTPPPVKVCANELGIPVFQPAKMRDGEALGILKELNPEIIVVVAYGKILPKEILELPKYGCVNGHASLLPRHRGASPIQWSIVCGDTETGVTTMLMDEGMDTGDILDTIVTPIGDKETGEELFDRLSVLSAELMVETVKKLKNGEITPKKQPEEGVSYAPIIKKEMALLDFSKKAEELYNLVRGFYSWPCAYLFLEGKRMKVLSAEVAGHTDEKPGVVIKSDTELVVSCAEGTSLRLLKIQPEGSKAMEAKQYLLGKKIAVGTALNGEM